MIRKCFCALTSKDMRSCKIEKDSASSTMGTRFHAESMQTDLRVCHIHPVDHSEEEGIIVDGLCPMKTTVTGAEMVEKGKEVIRLLKTIDREAKERTRLARATYSTVSPCVFFFSLLFPF